jgi:hypothetical protein
MMHILSMLIVFQALPVRATTLASIPLSRRYPWPLRLIGWLLHLRRKTFLLIQLRNLIGISRCLQCLNQLMGQLSFLSIQGQRQHNYRTINFSWRRANRKATLLSTACTETQFHHP